jgi:2-polyprenyl-3-methyl-5-hydroxy-6-metoxy-1,4-benzoquinol methylase
MKILAKVLNKLKPLSFKATREQIQFSIYELAKLNERVRAKELGELEEDSQQTLESFNYQWEHLPAGSYLTSDPVFMKRIESHICEITGLAAEWFKGKKVIDIGCGNGRFTYGLLSLGAEVTACDASSAGIKQTRTICQTYGERLKIFQANIIKDALPRQEFDLAFCFGVVHHTGNTYLAIKKVYDTAKVGGKIFLMVYGYPEKYEDFVELNSYEALREKLRPLGFKEKVEFLRLKYPENQLNGIFDAASPRINDLLKYGELKEFLNALGVDNVRRTLDNRNLHVIGDKKR